MHPCGKCHFLHIIILFNCILLRSASLSSGSDDTIKKQDNVSTGSNEENIENDNNKGEGSNSDSYNNNHHSQLPGSAVLSFVSDRYRNDDGDNNEHKRMDGKINSTSLLEKQGKWLPFFTLVHLLHYKQLHRRS